MLKYATRNPILIPVDSPLVAHNQEFLRYVHPCEWDAIEDPLPTSADNNSPKPNDKLLQHASSVRLKFSYPSIIRAH